MTDNKLPTVSPFGAGVSLGNLEAAQKALAASATEGALGTAPDGSSYMNFSGKRGVYEFGQEKEDISDEERWVINVGSFQGGYICWKGGRPVATRLGSIYSGPVPAPDPDEHGPFNVANGEGWHQAKAMVLRSLDYEDRQGYFKVNSKSAVAVIADLQKAVVENMQAGLPFWPVVRMGREKFQAKGQWNYKPTIIIDGYLSTEAVNYLGRHPETDVGWLLEMSASMQPFPEDGPPAEAGDPEYEAEAETQEYEGGDEEAEEPAPPPPPAPKRVVAAQAPAPKAPAPKAPAPKTPAQPLQRPKRPGL